MANDCAYCGKSKKIKTYKRVFLITVDCLRADHVGLIGGGILTPNIDKFAKEGITFKKAFANGPGTNQSFPAIHTSTYFLMHGGMQLLPHYTTLAEVMSKQGFKTVAFHSNPFLSKSLGWGRGFHEFYDFMDVLRSPSAAITRSGLPAKTVKFLNKMIKILNNKTMQSILRRFYYMWSNFEIPYTEGNEINKYVIRWINKNKQEKFFIWMHYMDPHRPYIPPSPYLDIFSTRKEAFMFDTLFDQKISQGTVSRKELETLKKLYEGEVRYVDDCIGKLIDFLNIQGLLEDSLIVLTADHGEAFMEHNKLAHAHDIVYNEVLHVPLMIYGLTDYSITIENFVQLLDISPTILDAIGVKKPESFLGDSLTHVLEGEQKSEHIISESAQPDLINLKYDTQKKVISCIVNNWKLIINELHETRELYDIGRDFSEQNNIINNHKDIVEELLSIIKSHFTNCVLHNTRARAE